MDDHDAWRRSATRIGCRWAARLLVMAAALAGPGQVEAAPCLRPPVVGAVVDPFRPPACTWCAGNRGLEYRVADDTAVRAAASGTVTFVGVVAGTPYLVVELPNGWRLTYGRLAVTQARSGDTVVAGSILGRATGQFYFGLRIGDAYRDPAPFIGRLVGRSRLIPVDGTPQRPTPPGVARCRVGQPAR
jgi:murein DD-endopeptidase MepM/ murein hydrolase activator NlpD